MIRSVTRPTISKSVSRAVGGGAAGGGGGASLLLDTRTAQAAWSLTRPLKTGVTSLFRVRRSTDSEEQDIGVSGGIMDSASLLSFAGAGDAFVVTVYDHTGNDKHLTQSTSTLQPRIVSSGVLEVGVDHEKPCANDFDGTRRLPFPDVQNASSDCWWTMVFEIDIGSSGAVIIEQAFNGKWIWNQLKLFGTTGENTAIATREARTNILDRIDSTYLLTHRAIDGFAPYVEFWDSATKATLATQINTDGDSCAIIGTAATSGGPQAIGGTARPRFSEMICWDDEAGDYRIDITTNLAAFYGVTL
jgi:hypothetical protein